MDQKIKPIIKWTGGKYREFALFKDHIPSFERYIEPFFGGGGVFFALQPKTPVIINDKSTDLINFYRQINEPEFKEQLYKYADAWDEIKLFSDELWKKCTDEFTSFINETNQLLKESLKRELSQSIKPYQNLVNTAFVIEPELFQKYIQDSLLDKAIRIQRICKKENRVFDNAELKDHFETGIKSGMYLFFRMLMNKNAKTPIFLKAKAAANWYFVREFCYAAMFRYNNKGEFNIPYGGIAYNKKNFRQKADFIFAEATQKLFGTAAIYNQDFEEMLVEIALKPTDFIFLDPPYDSEFSEYDQNSFTQTDQKRLADFLINCPAKWMVVIKETPFIREIYTHPQVKIVTFGKNYTYNVRGRNDRKVTHLVITNY
ncbi:DNA adenine methylase [Pedobacter sp. SL55]|uniref:DNA adenine methylase n=1 Tax=Pedobacter sp. SL55 TaxID=2995161 RepID=UPI00226FDAF5|nr:DNA adenine methylase [Pedobacter sp. SL55]WAC40479.1 DNA adenine methylase [Pedobacter sp. SL55]